MIFQSAWINQDCIGPPVIMMQFEDTSNRWSPMYSNHRANYASDECGKSPLRMSSGCCISAIRPEENHNYGSTTHAVERNSRLDVLPKAALQATYCHLRELNTTFREMYVLDDGNCYENFQCKNETLWIYPWSSDKNCIGRPTTIKLGEPVHGRSSPVGDIAAKMVTINEASLDIGWTMYFPSNYLNPESPHISYPLGIGFTFMAIFGTLVVGTFYSYRFYKGRTIFMLAYMCSQLLWLIWIILDSYLLYSIFPDGKVMELVQKLRNVCLGIATLMSVFITANVLLKFMKRDSLGNQLSLMIVLISLHLTLAGALYFSDLEVSLWTKLTAVWIIFMYFFDITPPLFVFCALQKSIPKSKGQRLSRKLMLLHKCDRFVGILLMLQVINAIWFGAIVYLTQYTTILKNDRYLLSMGGPQAFSFVFHSIVSCVLNHHIRFMLNLGAQLEGFKSNVNKPGGKSKGKGLPLIKTDFSTQSDGAHSEAILLPKSAYTPSSAKSKNFSDWDDVSITSDSETPAMFITNTAESHVPKSDRSFYSLSSNGSSNSSQRSPKEDPYKAFRLESPTTRPMQPNRLPASLKVDTSSLVHSAKSSPSLSPLLGYSSMERPTSTYSMMFEAHRERYSATPPFS